MSGYSLSWLKRERDELVKDRTAFATAYDVLKRRIIESNETELARHPLLHEWSGTRAVMGSLEMSMHAVERTIEQMEDLIMKMENGEVPNQDHDGGNN